MSGYIGPIPTPQATQTRQIFTATAGQTIFATMGYTPGYVDVYLNGVKLVANSDYTAINGSDITLVAPAELNDSIEMVAYKTFDIADQSVVAIYDPSILYVQDQPVFYEGEPYKINPNDPPATGESPASHPAKWIATGGGGSAGSKNFVINPLTSAALGNWTRSAGTLVWNDTHDVVTTGALTAATFTTGQTIDGDLIPAVNPVDGGQAWQISLGYYIDAGATYTEGQIQVYLLDGANEIAGGNLPIVLGTVSQTKVFVFPSTTLTGLKVRIKCTGGTGTIRIADVNVSPQAILTMPAVSGWIPYTPTFQGFGTPTNVDFKYRRVGENVEILGRFTAGTTTAVEGRVGLPSGLLSSSTIQTSIAPIGTIARSVNGYTFNVIVEPSKDYICFGYSDLNSNGLSKTNGNTLLSLGSTATIGASIPIAQWSTSIQVSGEEVEYAYNFSTTTTNDTTSFAWGPEGSPFYAFPSTLDNYNATNKRVRFRTQIKPTDSVYLEFYGTNQPVWVSSSENSWIFNKIENTSIYGASVIGVSGDANALDVRFGGRGRSSEGTTYGAVGSAWSSLPPSARWRVVKRSGGSMAEVPPVVRAEYTGSDTVEPGATVTRILFNTKVEDTHNAVTTGASWKFTCPVRGIYSVEVQGDAMNASTVNGFTRPQMKINNVLTTPANMGISPVIAGSTGFDFSGQSIVRLQQGDELFVELMAIGANTNYANRRISITRIGS